MEYFRIPRSVLTVCLGKSTYARCGIIVNVTPFEPEWEGYVTLEFSNDTAAGQDLCGRRLRSGVVLRVRRGLRNLVQGSWRQIPGAGWCDFAENLTPPRHENVLFCDPLRRVAAFQGFNMRFHFPVIIIDEDFRSENTSGLGIRALAEAIEKEGLEVLGVTSYGDLTSFAQQQSRASAFILSIDDEELALEPEETLAELRAFVRKSAIGTPKSPSSCTAKRAPRATFRMTCCANCTVSSTCSRTRRSSSPATSCAKPRPTSIPAAAVLPRAGALRGRRLLFVALPGPLGRRRLPEEPVGQMFHQFFGENMLRADVCNAVEELGQLLDHTGPVAASERNAARIFNCDHLYFVTNGTSTSNKIVWHSTVAPGDIVVVDRNCHKSILHAIMMTGAIPVFLMPTRNNFGIIGPIPKSEFAWKASRKRSPPIRSSRQDGQAAC
jgi:hypothetical protein